MKRIIIFLSILFLSLLFNSCDKNSNTIIIQVLERSTNTPVKNIEVRFCVLGFFSTEAVHCVYTDNSGYCYVDLGHHIYNDDHFSVFINWQKHGSPYGMESTLVSGKELKSSNKALTFYLYKNEEAEFNNR
ncbi:MAG: hypothetical protein LBR45_02070 [Bacteroidales bacterium]|jgi:hypothetical protein|nr:hypothetical protein [Bacteroidales bacterium]